MPRFTAFLWNFNKSFSVSRAWSSSITITIFKPLYSFMDLMSSSTMVTFPEKSTISEHLKNDRVDEARRIFDKNPSPDLYLYTMMISGYSRFNRIDEALQLFEEMPVRDVVSWNSMMKGCLDCGYLKTAWKLFNEMPERNVISWTTILNGFSQFGDIKMAEELFDRMPQRDMAAWNSMIFGYLSNGRIEDACKLFDEMPQRNVISWTSMIGGLDKCGKSEGALSLFKQMQLLGVQVQPTSSTFACVLTTCANIVDLGRGVQIHAHLFKSGYIFDTYISTSLITFYANCMQIENSLKIFQESSHKNVVIFTALLTGYGLNGKHGLALKLLCDMAKVGIKPNQSSFTSALNSCSVLEVLDIGKEIHTMATKLGLDRDVFVGNSLIVMYTKCGNIDDGILVFNEMNERNLVSWNAIILGCAQHGGGILALELFNQMALAKVEPDEITYVGLLSACSHSRMLDKGKYFFELLNKDENVDMRLEHYACMVDILGRCGNLDEAEEFIRRMPMKPNSMVWLALLSACRVHNNLEIATRGAESVLELEPSCSAAYVLLSNAYASGGRWNDVSRIRKMMKERRIVKQPGRSWVILKGSKHEFLSGDTSHPMSKKIYLELDTLGGKLKEFGYVPDQSFALHDVEDEQKEVMLAYHSERLAIGFALITTVEGSTIRVMKNLRVCGDCHSAIKLISKIVGREIIVRDSSRFHHFRDGNCSCGDYW